MGAEDPKRIRQDHCPGLAGRQTDKQNTLSVESVFQKKSLFSRAQRGRNCYLQRVGRTAGPGRLPRDGCVQAGFGRRIRSFQVKSSWL